MTKEEVQEVVSSVPLIDPLKDEVSRMPMVQEAAINLTEIKPNGDPLHDDFRAFLTMLWRHLGLPDPTPLQLDIAYSLQHSKHDREIIMGFRGVAKSWITAAFALWTLYRNPQAKILVASGSVRRSIAFVNFCLVLIGEVEELKHLMPQVGQRMSGQQFDVGPARPDQTPSVFAVGITAQIVGFRGDLIIGDDVETNTNSMTPTMRAKLKDSVREFDAILKPFGRIVFLGTPQTESSIYNELYKNRGFHMRIWPARYPTPEQFRSYGEKLAPYIAYRIKKNPRLKGLSTEPTRFSDEDLAKRELSWGRAGFAFQFMLDTSLVDVNKYPLRLRDMVTMGLDHKRGPDYVTWGSGDHLAHKELNAIAMDGDGLFSPGAVSDNVSEYSLMSGFIDPSGKGVDEATLTIGGVINSTPYVLKQKGWLDGYSDDTLKDMARLIVLWRVKRVMIEEDFGQGMFAQLLRPHVQKAWDKVNKLLPARERGTTEILSERAPKVQKEIRIIEILEPLFASHRLVMNKEVIEEDYQQVMKRDGQDQRENYSLMYQITRLTRERDCLTNDDRVEGLAGLMKMFTEVLGLDPKEQADEREVEDVFKDLRERYGPGVEVIHEEEKYKGTVSNVKYRGNLRSASARLRNKGKRT